MILSTAETKFDFDAPRVNGDGTAVISLRCYIGGVLWGAKDISMTAAQVDSVIDAPVTPGLSRRADVYVAFAEWLMREGIIAGTFEPLPAPAETVPVVVEPQPEAPVVQEAPQAEPVPPAPEVPYEVPVVQGEPEVVEALAIAEPFTQAEIDALEAQG